MFLINRALTGLFDLLLAPFDRLPAVLGLAILALGTAIAVLLVFKWTSDQPSLTAAKRAIQAAIFEMRLFNDDLVLLFRAQGGVLRHTATYLRHSFAPTLWLLVPMMALLLHMEFRFGYSGLTVGHTALLKARLTTAAAPVTLEAPAGIDVETDAVHFPSQREVVWRIRPRSPGSYELRVDAGGARSTKTVEVSDRVARRSPVRPGSHFIEQLLNPSEPPLPDATGLADITVEYPDRPFTVAGWNIGWSGVYLLLTLVFAFLLKGLFGVTI